MIILESQKYKLETFPPLKDLLHEWLCCLKQKTKFPATHFFLRLYQNDLLFFTKISYCQITIWNLEGCAFPRPVVRAFKPN